MPISPNQGGTGGGTTVTITGVNLAGATAVMFGGRNATITANTPTSVTTVAPAGTGLAPVSVTTAGGSSNDLPFFFVPGPTVISVSATAGPTAGGNTTTITGINLSSATSVDFGGNTATPTVVSDGMLTVTVPAGSAAGSVALTVTTAGGRSRACAYTYVDSPTISAIGPASGPSTGGNAVSITGTGLAYTAGITFDGVPANFLVISSTEAAALAPPGSAGAVDVSVTTAGGSSTAVGGYTYVAGPGI
jgi:hypothetical protein